MKEHEARVLISETVQFISEEELRIKEIADHEEAEEVRKFYESHILNGDDEEIEELEEDEAEEIEEADPNLLQEIPLFDCMLWGRVLSGEYFIMLKGVREYVDRLALDFEVFDSKDCFESRSVEMVISPKEPTEIYQFEMPVSGISCPVSLSIGSADGTPSAYDELFELISRADAALYAVKARAHSPEFGGHDRRQSRG